MEIKFVSSIVGSLWNRQWIIKIKLMVKDRRTKSYLLHWLEMVSLARLSFPLALSILALFETFLQVASVVKELRPTIVNGSFVATLPIADSIFDTTCALFCNRLDICAGISMENPKEVSWCVSDYYIGSRATNFIY